MSPYLLCKYEPLSHNNDQKTIGMSCSYCS